MKKIVKALSIFAALAMLGSAFIGCSDDDGGSSGGSGDDTQQGGGTGGGEGGGQQGGGQGAGGGEGSGEEKTYSWWFNTDISSSFQTISGGDFNGKFNLTATKTIKDKDNNGLDLTLYATDSASENAQIVYNKYDHTTAIGSSMSFYSEYHDDKVLDIGAIEPNGKKSVGIENVKGPFTVTAYVGSTGSSDKTDRYAYIMKGDEEVCAPGKDANTLKGSGEKLTYTYEGTDKVNIYLGCTSGYVRIYAINLTSTAAQSQYSNFAPSTENVTNDIATLGLVGATVASSAETVATAAIVDGKVAITSVAEGDATVTVTDANGKTATIAVSVNGAGAVTASVSSKYAVAKPVVAGGVLKATVTGSIENLVYATSADATEGTAVTAAEIELEAGTYYFWYKATEAYAASEKTAGVLVTAAAVTATTVTYDVAALSAESPIKDLVGTYKKGTTDEAANTAISSNSITLDADVTIPDASSNTSLVLTAAGTGVGNSKASGTSYVTYKTNKAVFVKRDGIKVTGIKGNVKVTVSWIMGSQKAAGNRKLEVTALSTGETVETPCNAEKGAQTDCVITANFGEGGDLFIGASDEAGVTKIKIEPAN